MYTRYGRQTSAHPRKPLQLHLQPHPHNVSPSPFPPDRHHHVQQTNSPAAPFPELYALPGIDVTAFIHVKYVWDPLTVAQIGTFHMLTRNLQLTIRNTMRYHGDQKLPVKGFARKGGGLEYRIHPVPSRRCVVSPFRPHHFLFLRMYHGHELTMNKPVSDTKCGAPAPKPRLELCLFCSANTAISRSRLVFICLSTWKTGPMHIWFLSRTRIRHGQTCCGSRS